MDVGIEEEHDHPLWRSTFIKPGGDGMHEER
jgi:hypothetical protein